MWRSPLLPPKIGIEGCHSDESLEHAGGALTEFGQFGDDGGTGCCGDAWNALEQVAAFTHGLAGGDLFGNRVLDAFDLLVEGLDHALDAGLDVLLEDHAEVIFLGNACIDELAATQGGCLQTGLLWARQGGVARPGPLAEGGQHAGIDGIGFGQPADAFGEMPDLAGICACDRHVLAGQRRHDDQLIATGCLDDDEPDAAACKLPCELARRRLAVGRRGCLERSIGVQNGDVEGCR